MDHFGDSVVAAKLCGDSWRSRHNFVKTTINSLCNWAAIPTQCEVFGLFSYLIPTEALNRVASKRTEETGVAPRFQTGNSQFERIGSGTGYNHQTGPQDFVDFGSSSQQSVSPFLFGNAR